jgi:CheY-like chemotaxis protein
MKTLVHDEIGDARLRRNRLHFALVIDQEDHLRNSIMALLREHGWLVHGVSRPEHAFGILPHIPYSLIVLGPELPGLGAIDFVRILRNSRQWQTINLVVINNAESAEWESQITESGMFVVRRSMWQDDLFGFLIAHGEDSQMGNAYSPI